MRQKVAQPTHRIENENDPEAMPQCFQVFVNIIECRDIDWANPQATNSHVIVVLGTQKRRTSIKRNTLIPYYRESVVFDFNTSVRSMEQLNLWLTVVNSNIITPQVVGVARIDLRTIWDQPFHRILHKWVHLYSPYDSSTSVGYLKVDVSTLPGGEIRLMPATLGDDDLEENLFLPNASEQQRAKYTITIYGALGLPNDIFGTGGRGIGKPPSTYVNVSFCGLLAKTAVRHRSNNPLYSEQITLVEKFPNVNQFIRFELYSVEGTHKVAAVINLSLSDISHDADNGYLPTFGPSFLHMYGTPKPGEDSKDSPYYKGALVIGLTTVIPYYKQEFRSMNIKHVEPIKLESLWSTQDFFIYCPIFEVSMLDCKIVGKICGVAITIGDFPCGGETGEFQAIVEGMRSRKLHYTGCLPVEKTESAYGHLNFNGCISVLQLATHLPDFRTKINRKNMLQRIVNDLDAELSALENSLINIHANAFPPLNKLRNTIEDTAAKLMQYLSILHVSGENSCVEDHVTELDLKQLTLQKEEIGNIYNLMLEMKTRCSIIKWDTKDIRSLKKALKLLITDTRCITYNLRNLLFKILDGWPDIVVWLLSGGSRVGYTRISPSDIVYSISPNECGKFCGKIQTVFMKPLKCFDETHKNCCCVVGKVELLLWMGLSNQQSDFNNYLPYGFTLRVKEYKVYLKVQPMKIECRAFVCKAKLNDASVSYQYFVRINAFNSVEDTQSQNGPILCWNQFVRFSTLMSTTFERLLMFPPIVVVELYAVSKEILKLVGRVNKVPVVIEKDDIEAQLEWYDLCNGEENTGRLLMSVQIFQIPEKILKTTTYNPVQEIYYANYDAENSCSCENDAILSFPTAKSYKIDLYWWGLRELNVPGKPCIVLEIEDLAIKSEVICKRKTNSNFRTSRSSWTFEAPTGSIFPLNINLCQNHTFGRTTFLGSVTKSPTKYIVNWLPKTEYEALINGVPIVSSEFVEANKTLFIKKRSKQCSEIFHKGLFESETFGKRAKWKQLMFKRKLSDEEEILIPMKERTCNDECGTELDWWSRYLRSQENTSADNMDVIVYGSELESQPEFSKFKDWCATIKMYCGKKTGMKVVDEALLCGYLKVGVAIYKCPPMDMEAVSSGGVDLNRGYFSEYPKNELAKFLVRVYLVQGENLEISDYSECSGLYVALCCGSKYVGDRSIFLPKSLNPIFGNMYEFSCSLPEQYLLTVSIYNSDLMSLGSLIGSTSIDLENRVYSKHRATVGLPAKYSLSEPGKWRDIVPPSTILEDICQQNHIPPPIYPDCATVIFNGVEYSDCNDGVSDAYISTERKENLCLSILRKWQTLPICGYHLVPEHVETRSLFHPDKPAKQGKIKLWVDIFPVSPETYIPPAVNITPRKTENYELSLTIFKVRTEKSWCGLRRHRRAVYFKAWIGSANHAQNTDIHYETTSSNVNINYYMVFHFQYQPSIKKLIRKQTGAFTGLTEYVPPTLVIQLKDDTLSSEDYIGILMFNLNDIAAGTKRVGECSSENYKKLKRVNLFSTRNSRGWWPLKSYNSKDVTGRVKMELTLLKKNKEFEYTFGMQKDASLLVKHSEHSRSLINSICNVVKGKNEKNRYFYIILITILCMVTISLLVLMLHFGHAIILL